MTGRPLPFISAAEVRSYLPMTDAIDAMRDAFRQLSDGRAAIPRRSHLDLPERHGVALFMPGYLPESDALGIKIVTLFGGNPESGLPLIHALMVILDAKTGAPVALIDGEELTAIRTGAASGLATDLLARRESEVLTLFGAGTQSRTQLEAVAAVRNLKKVFVVDADRAKAESFVRTQRSAYPFSMYTGDTDKAVREADIICTSTTAARPVFDPSEIRPGTHINAIGAYKPDRREIPAEIVARSLLIVDKREACLAEAGDLVLALREGYITAQHIAAELGELLLGRHPGRTGDDQITLFKSVGSAAQDLAASARILARSKNEST